MTFIRTHFPILIFSALLFLASCSAPTNPPTTSQPATASTESTPAEKPKGPRPPDDPTFSETKEIVSLNGPYAITRNILQDATGMIWFATWQGIMNYDGEHFTNITLQESLGRYHTFSILECRNGNLWFGTIDGGAYRYDGRSYVLFTTADGLADNAIMWMLEDLSGNTWFGTKMGLSRYDGKSFTNYTMKDGLLGDIIYALEQDKNGKIWIGTGGGINVYDPSTSSIDGGKLFTTITHDGNIPFYHTRCILEDRSGNMWIGGQEGLYRYDGKSFAKFNKNFIGAIAEDNNGNIWISDSSDEGMALLRYDGKTFTRIPRPDDPTSNGDESAAHDSFSRQIFSIIEDKLGNIWIASPNGVSRYDGTGWTDFAKK